MALQLQHLSSSTTPKFNTFASQLLPIFQNVVCVSKFKNGGITSLRLSSSSSRIRKKRTTYLCRISASLSPLDLTEDNIIQVLEDAKAEVYHIFKFLFNNREYLFLMYTVRNSMDNKFVL